MNITERKCKHCGCNMPCMTARRVYCAGKSCRITNFKQKALIMSVQTIVQALRPQYKGTPLWRQPQVLTPS